MNWVEFNLQNGMVGKVDKEDWPLVSQYKWRAAKNSKSPNANWYIRASSGPIEGTFMHRLLLCATPKNYVDHINGDGLDNRRSNIRLCSALENAQNRKPTGEIPYKGVSNHKNGFQTKITINGDAIHLGYHATPTLAALAYDRIAITHGAFNTNFDREIVDYICKLESVAEAAEKIIDVIESQYICLGVPLRKALKALKAYRGEKTKMKAHQLHETMDADIWAKEFMRLYGDKPNLDLDLMRAWFANAIMCGYDHARNGTPHYKIMESRLRDEE